MFLFLVLFRWSFYSGSISDFCSSIVFSISVTSSPSYCYFGFGEPRFLLPACQVLAQVLYFCCHEVAASTRCSLPSRRFSAQIFVPGCRCLRFPPDVICFPSVLVSSDCVRNFIAFDPYLAWSDPIEASSFPGFTAILVCSHQGFPFYFLIKSCSLFLSCLWTSSPGVASVRQCTGLLLLERAQFTSSWSLLAPSGFFGLAFVLFAQGVNWWFSVAQLS
jgi:hypothetical protein